MVHKKKKSENEVPLKHREIKDMGDDRRFCGNVSEKGTISGKTLASMGSILGFSFMLMSGALSLSVGNQISGTFEVWMS